MTVTGWFHAGTVSELLDLESRTDVQRRSLPTFTERGFEVMSTPPDVHRALTEAYRLHRADATPEAPDPGVLPTGEPELVPIGDLGHDVARTLQPIHEAWVGQALEYSAAYGIRSYHTGQTLVRHCDRVQTHVISSIVHIDHDGEPWPLVIEDHDGAAHDIVLEPGQMVLYESARCPHGRPTPFTGTHYASVFVHYHPVGWTVDEDLLVLRSRLSAPMQ